MAAVATPRIASEHRTARSVRRQAAAGRVRLTVRGRLMLLGLLLVLVTLVTGLAAAPGEAAGPAGAPVATVVRPGDTLWSIARRYAPDRDPFETIDEIRRLNGITDYTVRPGQRLTLPTG